MTDQPWLFRNDYLIDRSLIMNKVSPSLQEKQLIRLTTKIIFNLSNENWNFGKLVYEVEIFPILKSFLMKLLVILTNTNF